MKKRTLNIIRILFHSLKGVAFIKVHHGSGARGENYFDEIKQISFQPNKKIYSKYDFSEYYKLNELSCSDRNV